MIFANTIALHVVVNHNITGNTITPDAYRLISKTIFM